MKLYLPLLMLIVVLPLAYAEEDEMPLWIKSNAGLWNEGVISDEEFKNAITFLVNEQIIDLSLIDQLQNRIIELEAENERLKAQIETSAEDTAPEAQRSTVQPEPTSETLRVSIDGIVYDIEYVINGGTVEGIYHDARGITVAVEAKMDGTITLALPKDAIDDFTVTVEGRNVDEGILVDSNTITTIAIPFMEDDRDVDIMRNNPDLPPCDPDRVISPTSAPCESVEEEVILVAELDKEEFARIGEKLIILGEAKDLITVMIQGEGASIKKVEQVIVEDGEFELEYSLSGWEAGEYLAIIRSHGESVVLEFEIEPTS